MAKSRSLADWTDAELFDFERYLRDMHENDSPKAAVALAEIENEIRSIRREVWHRRLIDLWQNTVKANNS